MTPPPWVRFRVIGWGTGKTFLARWGCWWPFSLWMEIIARAHEQTAWKHFYSRKQSSSWMLSEWTWPFEREGFWRYTMMLAGGCETQVLQSESESPRIRDSTCFHCLSITQPVPLFLPLISKTSWTWCWEIDELVKCISYDHKGLSLTPMTSIISWVWWCTLIIPTLGRWSVPGATWSSRSMKDSISKKGSQKLTTPKVVLCPLLVGLYIHTSQTPNQLPWAWPCVVFTVKDCSKKTGHCC